MTAIHSTHIAKPATVSTVMLKVLAALLPGIALSVYCNGIGILLQLLLASLTALGAEAAMLRLRGVPVWPALKDLSAIVTAWLLALSLPPLGGWWMIVTATLFAIIVAKQLYGGLGNNPFNPAMAGFALMVVSFPAQMAQWGSPQLPLDAAAQWQWIFLHTLAPGSVPDAISSATPLDVLKTGLRQDQALAGLLPSSSAQELIALGWLAGGLWLWRQKLIPWQTPVAMLAGLLALALPLWLWLPTQYASPMLHLLQGGTLLAAAFIVTDPVSGSTTPRGRLIFGFGVGLLTYVIRVFGNFPDGIAFAVLLMNMTVPLLDQYTRPAVFGHRKGRS
ncbi:RnfABCDGE type electron transport complex subunit D [Vogesella indigofera]|uniref:RnfABCDGE type electron transport complex subunit D n=1 Tax=Vogesella indigofera TaxID=45465 RepID=UPI0035ADC7A7